MPPQDERVWLQRLAAFAPVFRDAATMFGNWHCEPGTLTGGWYELSKIGWQFRQMVCDAGWVSLVSTWSEWMESPDGRVFSENRNAINAANYEQLARLLEALVRKERWDECCWKQAFEGGLLLAVAERAETIGSTDEWAR